MVTTSGTRVEADIWFRCHGVAPAPGYLGDDLMAARTRDGYLNVTSELQVVGFDRVYALGDIAAIDANKAGVAGRQGVVVASNIQAQIAGTDERTAYTPGPPVIILPTGTHRRRGSAPEPGRHRHRRVRLRGQGARHDDRPVCRALQRSHGTAQLAMADYRLVPTASMCALRPLSDGSDSMARAANNICSR